MRVCCISDLHGHLINIKPCDLLVIAGDICGHASTKRNGTRPPAGGHDDIMHQARFLNTFFREWLELIPAKDVVAVPGNHDFVFERTPYLVPTDLRWTLLNDSVAVVQGKKIYGSPFQHAYGSIWCYNAPPRDDGGEDFLERKYSMIPDDTDIIVVHGPPYSYGDAAPRESGSYELTGSTSLSGAIHRVKPDLSVHGHIHMGYGSWELERGNCAPTRIVNASICNEQNEPTRQPFYFDI